VTASPPRRGRWVALLLAAAALAGLVALPTWVRGTGASALEGAVTVQVAGAAAAPQVGGAALVLAAAAGALGLVARAGRVLVAVVAAGAGLLVAGAGVAVLRDPAGAVTGALADATGVPTAASTALTPWPAVALVLGAATVLLAAALLRAPGDWTRRSSRHEVPAARPARDGHEPDERDDWDALSRGDDPS
jgi:uncharacterized membrane protein (TIGR02234 family)